MRKITFDIETRNFFQDVGSNDPVDLDISVVCIHDSLTDAYTSYEQHQLKDLWPLIEQADMLITWNGDHFDIPLLGKYYSGDLSKIKSLDLMKEVRNVLGRRLKLDGVAEATLGTNKSAHGSQAVEWWKTGEIDKIIKYCIDDVKITKDLYDFAVKNGYLKYSDAGTIKQIKFNTSKWEKVEESAMTYTLPF